MSVFRPGLRWAGSAQSKVMWLVYALCALFAIGILVRAVSGELGAAINLTVGAVIIIAVIYGLVMGLIVLAGSLWGLIRPSTTAD